MLFNSIPFLILFAIVFAAHRLLPTQHRRSVLLVGSLVFYSMWIPVYLALFVFVLAASYGLLRLMVRSDRPRIWLITSVVLGLVVLAFFKYAAFFVSSFLPVLEWANLPAPEVPEILLPLGISFFTFQILALTIDTYRGEVEPVDSFSEYALFISFFPQLIAGPIVRGWQLLPQIREGGRVTRERSRQGVWLIALGLSKKVLVADLLLAPYVNRVFTEPGFNTAPEHLIAVYSFAFQIYFDFSGYTDMARGLAKILGLELPLNFREPYLSRNPAEFWRRWHITLSQWLRDYLYIPLGGNRSGLFRTQRNLFLTMLLGGLWHGAAWNFVIWGGLHGILLIIHRWLPGSRGVDDAEGLRWADIPRILFFFHLVCFAWIFFRAESFAEAIDFIAQIATGTYHQFWPWFQVLVVCICLLFHVLERFARLHFNSILATLDNRWGGALEGLLLGVIAGLVALFGAVGGEFIYFQF
jgi:D-alanyl-lipoteichoic acid acyltransferase DltB (MBOAT superfamily)